MNRLLNFSTHGGDPRLFADNWDRVDAFVAGQGFDGLDVMQIDRHDPFTSPAIERLFTRIEPADVVFEFSFRDLATWQEKIRVQKQALRERLWT